MIPTQIIPVFLQMARSEPTQPTSWLLLLIVYVDHCSLASYVLSRSNNILSSQIYFSFLYKVDKKATQIC